MDENWDPNIIQPKYIQDTLNMDKIHIQKYLWLSKNNSPPQKTLSSHKVELNWTKIGISSEYTQNTDRIHRKRRKYLLTSSNKCQKINLHPEKNHICRKVELNWTKIGIPSEYTQNTPKICTGYTGNGENTYSKVVINVKK